MTRASTRLLGALTVVLTAACSRGGRDASLQSDLDAATGTGLELAPTSGGTKVVSAIERLGEAAPRPTERKPQVVARAHAPKQRAPVATSSGEVAVVPTASPELSETDAPAESSPAVVTQDADIGTPAPAPRPRAPSRAPTRSSGRRGGYWSTGDVIRNAPFPINP